MPSLHLITGPERSNDDVLCAALQLLVHRDLMDAAAHLMADVGWTPVTVRYAALPRPEHARSALGRRAGVAPRCPGRHVALGHRPRNEVPPRRNA